MIATAAFVVLATRAAERAGPLIGAMVATLPVSAGPAYVFIALDHDPAFVGRAALSSLAVNAATIVFCVAYARIARTQGTIVSLLGSLAIWGTLATGIRSVDWTLAEAALLNVAAAVACFYAGQRYRHTPMPAVVRRWYDVPLRAVMVATLVTTVVAVSAQVGPAMTGILALFPIVLTSIIVIFQPRVGGAGTGAITANGVLGLAGYAVALVELHVGAEPLGSGIALALSLVISIVWNYGVVMIRRRRFATAAKSQ